MTAPLRNKLVIDGSLGMQEDTTTTNPVVADIRNFYKVATRDEQVI
jgi:hypothetical protein